MLVRVSVEDRLCDSLAGLAHRRVRRVADEEVGIAAGATSPELGGPYVSESFYQGPETLSSCMGLSVVYPDSGAPRRGPSRTCARPCGRLRFSKNDSAFVVFFKFIMEAMKEKEG